MESSRLWILILLSLPLLSTGCECRNKNGGAITALTAESEAEINLAQRQKEVFDRELERLSSLDDAPALPGTPGAEKLIQAADRLDKWIRDRAPDEHWIPENSFLVAEQEAVKTVATAREIVQVLHLLQDKEVKDPDGNLIQASETLAEERERIDTLFNQLNENLRELNAKGGPNLSALTQDVTALQKKFAGLKNIRNLDAARTRAFAKQLEQEAAQFNSVAEMLEKLNLQLRTAGLFVSADDVEYLKQSIWLRDIAQWARGEKQDTLSRVGHLFDWTVCNIELRDRTISVTQKQQQLLPQQYPWQTLLLGRGTVWDRTWVFLELMRQMRIDACLLSINDPDKNFQLVWAVGVLIDGQIYLYLPMYGMPLPGPQGVYLAEDGSLQCRDVATLAQVIQDESLLRQLDLSDSDPFPFSAKQLAESKALLLATPQSDSMRMKILETELSGEQNMVLYTNLHEQKKRFELCKELQAVELWDYPGMTRLEQLVMSPLVFEQMALFMDPHPKRRNHPLWTGRILYFQGKLIGQESAMMSLQHARLSDRDLTEFRRNAEFRNNPLMERMFQLMNVYASYWLGVTSFENELIPSAKDFFMGIEKNPINPWRNSVHYMLGRIAEREKEYDRAIQYYEMPDNSPGSMGSKLRAKWLKKARQP